MLCDTCKGARYRAHKNGDAWIVDRMTKLTFWRERLDYFAPVVVRNIKKVREQLESLSEETERATAQRLRAARAEQRKAQALN